MESAKTVDNLNGILAVNWVGGIFIGPADLSPECVYPGQSAHPEMRCLIRD